MQEFRTGATRGAMDAIHSKEETTRLRTQLGDLRGKLNDLENKVSVQVVCLSALSPTVCLCAYKLLRLQTKYSS